MKKYFNITFHARKIGGAILYESKFLFDNKENAMLFAHQLCKKHKCFFKIKEFTLV